MKILFPACVFAACVAPAALADVAVFFTESSMFHQNNSLYGKLQKGMEDFEESDASFGTKTPFPNPLMNGVPRPSFPNGIDATNLIIQTNITQSACPPTANPSNNQSALWVNGAGFIGSNSVKVGTDEFLNGLFSSIDLIFTTHDKTAVGLDVSTFAGFNQGHAGFIICAYDQFDNVLGTYAMPGLTPSEPTKNFIGVWSPVPIGRVNVWGIFDIPQPFAVDNIEMWVPAPSTAGLLAVASAGLMRRRR